MAKTPQRLDPLPLQPCHPRLPALPKTLQCGGGLVCNGAIADCWDSGARCYHVAQAAGRETVPIGGCRVLGGRQARRGRPGGGAWQRGALVRPVGLQARSSAGGIWVPARVAGTARGTGGRTDGRAGALRRRTGKRTDRRMGWRGGRTDGRAGELTNGPTSEPVDGRNGEQANIPTSEPADRRARRQADEQSGERASWQTGERAVGQAG